MKLLNPVDNPAKSGRKKQQPKSAETKKNNNSDGDDVSEADSGVDEDGCSPIGSQISGLQLDASKPDLSAISQKEIHSIMYANKLRLETTGIGGGSPSPSNLTETERGQSCDFSLDFNSSSSGDVWYGQTTGPRSRCGSDASQKSKTSVIMVESARRGSLISYDNTANALTVDDDLPVKKGSCCNRDGLGWPRILLPIGWLVAIGAIVAPAFFVILYSMDWGAKTSNDWLMTFFLSSFESIAVFDPIKVGHRDSWGRFPHYWPLCAGNPPVTGGFPAHGASNVRFDASPQNSRVADDLRHNVTSLLFFFLCHDLSYARSTTESESCRPGNFVATGGTVGCLCDDRQCHRWRRHWHDDNFWFSATRDNIPLPKNGKCGQISATNSLRNQNDITTTRQTKIKLCAFWLEHTLSRGCCARSRYQGQEQVITSHIYCGM